MKTRTCEHCGSVFNRVAFNRKSCSLICAKAINSRKAVELRRVKKYGTREPRILSFKCLECETEFSSLDPNRKYCSDASCVKIVDSRRAAIDHKKHRIKVRSERKPVFYIRQCKNCVNEFTSCCSTQKHCSRRCASNYASTRMRPTAKFKEWTERNRTKIRACNRERDALRRATDPAYRLRQTVRCLVRQSYKNRSLIGVSGVWTHLGYTPVELKNHIQSFFTEQNGFSWENHGSVWELEHVVPQSWFTFSSPLCEQFKECWSLSNLKPDDKHFNRRKGNRFKGSSDDIKPNA